MNQRQILEKHENSWLCPQGTRSYCSKGRLYQETKSPLRTEYMRDRDRIIHCKSFRRLLHKTQVFISPLNDHFRTRATHTLEVMQIATDISSALRLNRDLTEAIALGHDLGHSPFGHIGEAVLHSLYKDLLPNGSFRHAEFSLRIVDELEQRGSYLGLNLTWETRDGILHHSKGLKNLMDQTDTYNLPSTIEGQIVRIVDRIAYISHDFDDSIRGSIIKWDDVPAHILSLFSKGTSHVINYFAKNLIQNFLLNGKVLLSKRESIMIDSAKSFLTENVYSHPSFLPIRLQIRNLIQDLFQFYLDHPETMQNDFISVDCKLIKNKWQKVRIIIDYIAGMTDRFAIMQHENIFKKRVLWIPSNT